MNVVQVERKIISGISVRTTNANEMDADTSKIAALHQQFDKTVSVNYKDGARVYGVYFDYESDVSGEFSVLAGSNQIESSTQNLEQVSIAEGNYMVFEGKGEMPDAVIDTWTKIWNYFSEGGSEFQRAYTTDFELYKNQNEVEIYIAIKE